MGIALTEHPGALSLNAILALGDQTTVRNAFLDNKTWQRALVGGVRQEYRSIPLAGTYDAGESAIHVQVIHADTNAVIQVPDAGGTPQNWTLLDNSLSGGVWSGVLDRIPCTIHYCKLRFSSNGGSTVAYTSTCKFRVGAIHLAVGQSNMAGNFDGGFTSVPGEVYTTPAGVAGTAYFEGGVSGGSADAVAWRDAMQLDAMVIPTYFLQQTGIPSAVAAIAISASPLANLRTRFVTGQAPSPSGQAVVDGLGGDIETIMCIQGESGGGSNTETWMEVADAYHNDIVTYCGRTRAEIPFLALTLAAYLDGVAGDGPGPDRDWGYNASNHEMLRMNARYPNLHCVGTGMGEALAEGLHWTSLGGYRGCRTLAHGATTLAGYTTGFAPRITSATAVSLTETHVNVEVTAGPGLQGKQSNANFTGFEVYDPTNGEWVHPTSSSLVDENTISLIHPAISDDARRVAYGATKKGVGPNPVRDTSPIAMNLMPTLYNGIVCARRKRVVVPRYLDAYTGIHIVGAVPSVSYPHPFQFITRYLGPPQTQTRRVYVCALVGGSAGLIPIMQLNPSVGDPIPFDKLHSDAQFSYYQCDVPGSVTHYSVTATRPYITGPTGDVNSPFQMFLWAVDDVDDVGEDTPTFYYAETAAADNLAMPITGAQPHSAIIGLAGNVPHQNFNTLPFASEAFHTSDGFYDILESTNGFFIPHAFQRTNVPGGSTPDVIRIIPYDGTSTPPVRALALTAMAIPSSYETLPVYAPGTRVTFDNQHLRFGSQRLTL